MPEITVTQVVVTTTYLTSSISTPPSALPAFQSTALDVSKESVPAASSSSSQGAIGSTEGAGQANPKIVVIVGGTLAGLAVASILLFCVYLKLRKQRDIRGLFSPKQLRRPSWEVEPASGSARESSRVAPFPSSGESTNTATNLDTEPSIQNCRPHRVTTGHYPRGLHNH